jgi:hypothetical protein
MAGQENTGQLERIAWLSSAPDFAAKPMSAVDQCRANIHLVFSLAGLLAHLLAVR